ncbi:GDSL-like Lipase/Acylhydrolase [Xylariomycetidae sp. FL2044]|nr:GDSL-like Lipase/Acylhydrolase [Xylariomycetidae sp. FL2044]
MPSTRQQQAKKKTRFGILCLGNSLTAGYPHGTPYAERLKEKLEEAFPQYDVQYEVDGVPGDLVTKGSFIERMEMNWRPSEPKYDWTIVLGGTNDIGWGLPADKLIEGLQRAWDIPLSRGGKVLALTIPETKRKFETIIARRQEVNEFIKNYKKTNFFHFDLHSSVTYHGMPPADRPRYWEPDGVHLTAEGYALMGERIAAHLIRLLGLQEAQNTEISDVISDARARRAVEELIWEEERGDPKLLSQGYIVVRRSDLD